MPEAPEVAIIAYQLNDKLMGKQVKDFHMNFDDPFCSKRIKPRDYEFPGPRIFNRATAYGKVLLLDFDGLILVSNLGMTGGWIIQTADKPVPKYTHAYFILDDNLNLYYTDIRKFGLMRFMSVDDYLKYRRTSLGFSLLNWTLDNSYEIYERLRRRPKINVCKMLMDQKFIAGIGNYIKCETLYRCKIHPMQNIGDLMEEELFKLFAEAYNIANASLEVGGNTFQNFVDSEGKPGEFGEHLQVYGRKEDLNGNKVETIKTPDGRTTYYVPSVQVYK